MLVVILTYNGASLPGCITFVFLCILFFVYIRVSLIVRRHWCLYFRSSNVFHDGSMIYRLFYLIFRFGVICYVWVFVLYFWEWDAFDGNGQGMQFDRRLNFYEFCIISWMGFIRVMFSVGALLH